MRIVALLATITLFGGSQAHAAGGGYGPGIAGPPAAPGGFSSIVTTHAFDASPLTALETTLHPSVGAPSVMRMSTFLRRAVSGAFPRKVSRAPWQPVSAVSVGVPPPPPGCPDSRFASTVFCAELTKAIGTSAEVG